MSEPVTVSFDGLSTVTGAPCFLRIMLLRRPYAHSTDPHDREIIDCTVSVDAGCFAGRYGAYIWGHELVFLRAILTALHERAGQEAEGFIDLMENAFDVRFLLTPLGHLTLNVVARGHPGMGPDLHFSMQADQSSLPRWIKQLDVALGVFPTEIPIDVGDPLSYQGPKPL